MKPVYLLILFSVIYSNNIHAQDLEQQMVLKIPNSRSNFDISHDYHLTLLNMALVQAAKGRVVPKFEILKTTMSQGRVKIELMKGDKLDVYWLGSDPNTNKELRAIKIPTHRGLVGYRKFIINRTSVEAFDKVKSIQDLKQFTACQGAHWPDTQVLEEAKLPVTTSTVYENIFKMLDAKRCDYFPRPYHDIKNELFNFKERYPNFIQYDRILLHYPFAIYFYTNKSNEVLARWIEEGLEVISENGGIEELMIKHPLTAHIFPLKNDSHTLYLPLDNVRAEPKTNTMDGKYWLTPEDFGIETNLKNSVLD